MTTLRRPRRVLGTAAVAVALVGAGCAAPSAVGSRSAPGAPGSATSSTPSAPASRPRTVPTFTASVTPATAAMLRYSWHPGCPVPPSHLRLLRMRFWGFDHAPHTGALVVNAVVVRPVVAVFHRLYNSRFPIRRMQKIDAFRGSDDASMAHDNTSAFNCRYAVAPGPKHWSVHSFGEAIDVNPVENPYLDRGRVLPPAGARYVLRTPYRPGMAVRGGVLVAAFAAQRWLWGGRWSASPDYQHFSATGG